MEKNAVQIEIPEINILQKKWGKELFYFLRWKRKTIFEAHYPRQCLAKFLPFLIKIHGQLSWVM